MSSACSWSNAAGMRSYGGRYPSGVRMQGRGVEVGRRSVLLLRLPSCAFQDLAHVLLCVDDAAEVVDPVRGLLPGEVVDVQVWHTCAVARLARWRRQVPLLAVGRCVELPPTGNQQYAFFPSRCLDISRPQRQSRQLCAELAGLGRVHPTCHVDRKPRDRALVRPHNQGS